MFVDSLLSLFAPAAVAAMEGINFSALAPRYGSRPMLSSWSDIGTSSMNGGAFNWGNIWSGVKTFGNTLKTWGNRAWNSNTASALRKSLNDSNIQSKIVDGLTTGIHGAVDLANQEISKAVQKRLESRPIPDALVNESVVAPTEEVPEVVAETPMVVESIKNKRPAEEEELIIRTDEPPRYEDIFPSKSGNAPRRPVIVRSTSMESLNGSVDRPLATDPVAPKPIVFSRPSRRQKGWQGTLNSIVGLGVRAVKKQRCF